MKYNICKIFIIIVVVFTDIQCWGNEVITGRWVVVNSIDSVGHITKKNQSFKVVGSVFYLGANYIKFTKDKYENLVQEIKIFSEDEIFEGWRIKLSDIGITNGYARVLQYKVKKGYGYLPYSEFILAPEGSLIAITEYGLFKLVRTNDKEKKRP